MNQYEVELIYEPLLFLVMIIMINLLFKLYKYPLHNQMMIYLIMGILLIMSLIITRLNKDKLKKQGVHYTTISKIITFLIILITGLFLYYMLT